MTRATLTEVRTRSASIGRESVVVVGWAAMYFVVVLAAMAGLIAATTGWDAVVITSGSMSPTLRPGDVMFVDEHPDGLVGQQAVITFERDDGEVVTHRVFQTDAAESSYITKGDANESPDSDVVRRDDVIGVGWLVVPYIGTPVIWLMEGNTAAVLALALVAFMAVIVVAVGSRRTENDDEAAETDERFSPTAQRGITRVRLVVALMITMVLVVDGQGLVVGAIGLSTTAVVVAVLAGLGTVSLIAAYRSSRTSGAVARRFALVELAGDTLVVVFFVAAAGTSGVGWILMALPIIEAAIHFRLTGAFVHWIVMSGASIVALVWTNRVVGVPQSVAIDNLEQLVDRLGVLLLVVIPGSYLADQLLGDVVTQRRATSIARNRSQIIERVNDAGRDVARLGVDLFPTLVEATLGLGFDVADCWIGDPVGGWRPLASSGDTDLSLPEPGERGSALRPHDLGTREVFVDTGDPDHDDAASLSLVGLGAVVRITLAVQDSTYIVLRAGARRLTDDPASQAMALRLLSGQAAVALQNEQLISELRETHTEMQHRARFDSLSGLANRAHFVDALDHTLQQDDHDHTRTSVVFLDLDGFKAVNDQFGHLAGDSLLGMVADRMTSAVGDRGLVARLGGDEFTVLLVGHDPEVCDEVAEHIHDGLGAPFEIAGDRVTVGASIGIAHGEPAVATSEMLRRADVAMYAAKQDGGRRGTRRYDAALHELGRRTLQISAAITGAIERDELRIVHQPIVATTTGELVGVEALIRWTHADLGVVEPPEILDAAESADCVDALNAWIFRTALDEIASCTTFDSSLPFIAVNVTPSELELESLTDNMNAALATSGLDPSQVVVELSERIVADSLGTSGNVERLLSLGLRLALDDFGEGHTSLAHLRGLPISFLKLDRLFVQHAEESAEDRTILRSVVGLAHDLGFEVIAEGVENIEQHTIVTKAGAGLAQGFGLHRPMPIDELRRVLARSSSEAMDFDDLTSPIGIGSHDAAFPPPVTGRVG